MLTPHQRSQRARIAGLTSWANTPDAERSARTLPARRGFDQRFLNAAGGDPLRAEALRKLHFQRMAAKSARARSRRGAMAKRGTSRPGGAAR